MVINLEDVFLHGKSINISNYELKLNHEDFLRNDISSIDCKSSICIDLVEDEAIMNIDLVISFNFNCDCCMENLRKKMHFIFNHFIDDVSDSENDVDRIVIENYKLDLDFVIREDILLEFPSKILCKSDCKGICQRCGKNLNLGACNCEKSYVDPRMEVLKMLLE